MSDNPLSGEVRLDTSNYKAGITELNRQIRVIESGFRASAAAMGDWDQQSQGLEARTKALTGQMELQKQKVDGLTRVYEELAAGGATSAKELEELQIKINRETEMLNKMQNELNESKDSLSKMGQSSGQAGEKVEELGRKEADTANKTDHLKTVMGGLGNALKAGVTAIAGLAVSVAGIGAAVGKAVLDTAGASDDLMDLSAKTGISVERLQELSYAGKQVGTDLDTMTGSLSKMTRSMSSAATGKGDVAEVFKTLGVSVTDTSGKLLDSRDVFMATIDALGKVGDDTERDAMSMAIFGKNAMELNPLIKAGSKEMNQLSQEARDMGAVMSEDTVQGMASLADMMDGLKDGFTGIVGTMAGTLQPGFAAVLGSTQGYMKEFAGIVSSSGGDVGKMADGIGKLFGKIATEIGQKLPELAQTGLQILQALINSITANLPTLIPVVVTILQSLVSFLTTNLPIMMQAGVQLILALINGLLPQLPMLITAAIQMIVTLATGIAEALPQLIPAIVGIIPQIVMILVENLPLLIGAALQIILALVQGIIAAIPILLPEVPKIITAIYDALVASLPLIGQAAVDLVMMLITGLMGMLPQLGTAAVDIVQAITNGISELDSKVWEVGAAIVTGVWEGIKSKADWFEKQALKFFTDIVDKIKSSLGIKSPSTVFAGIGANMMDGLGVGFSRRANAVSAKVAEDVEPLYVNLTGSGNQGGISAKTQQTAPVIQISATVANDIDMYKLARVVADTIGA